MNNLAHRIMAFGLTLTLTTHAELKPSEFMNPPADAKPVWQNGKFSNGGMKIRSAGEDDEYIKFNVAPGTWSITATAKSRSNP